MGIEISKNSNSENEGEELLEGHYGYRIMKVIEHGPAMKAGLRVYEDFIVAVDDLIVEEDEDKISEYLKEKIQQQVKLVVWNCLDEEEREVVLVVSAPTKEMGYLGVIVRYESLFQAAEYTWHVISVVPNSPADEVGLMPQLDYIVGTPSVAFRSFDTLPQLVYDAAHLQNSLDLMVWSQATGKVRLISVEPEITEEGTPLLGCELAKGLLHQIPRRSTSKNRTEQMKPSYSAGTPNTPNSVESNESSTKDTTYSNSVDTMTEEFYDTRSPSSFEACTLEQVSDMDDTNRTKLDSQMIKLSSTTFNKNNMPTVGSLKRLADFALRSTKSYRLKSGLHFSTREPSKVTAFLCGAALTILHCQLAEFARWNFLILLKIFCFNDVPDLHNFALFFT